MLSKLQYATDLVSTTTKVSNILKQLSERVVSKKRLFLIYLIRNINVFYICKYIFNAFVFIHRVCIIK